MNQYVVIAVFITCIVDVLLLLGTDRLLGGDRSLWRCGCGGMVGALHVCACFLPGFSFLGNLFWRTVFAALACAAAFGITKESLRRGGVYWLLQMALSGVALSAGGSRNWNVLLMGGGICLLCVVLFRWGSVGRQFVPVELSYGDRRMKLIALRDTGNTLRDPVSGQSVIVVGADAAQALTGLTKQQLCQPVESIGCLPGLRLIPYKTIGTERGFLLALQLPQVRVGTRSSSRVVAFAPVCLSKQGTYQALAGGAI